MIRLNQNNISLKPICMMLVILCFSCSSSKVSMSDADCLQQLIDNADPLQTLVIPKRKYYLSETLFIPSNRTIDFNKSVIFRKSNIFDLIQNSDSISGNENIKIFNLELIGGNDTLEAVNPKHRFSGIFFVKVKNVEFKNVIVKETVNNETGAGVYFNSCQDVLCEGLHGFNNDRTAILIRGCNNLTVNGSTTAFNKGSGIALADSKNSIIKNIITHDNGYSNLSINGKNSIVENVVSYNSAFSGLNIGHSSDHTKADSSSFQNIISHSNKYEGITVSNSNLVTIDNVEVYGNYRNNIRVFSESNNVSLSRVYSYNSNGGQGLLIESGLDHKIVNSKFVKNKNTGIYIQNASVNIGSSVYCYGNNSMNNESAEIIVNNATNCIIEIPNNIKTKLNNYIWISGGNNNYIISNKNIFSIRSTNKANFKLLDF